MSVSLDEVTAWLAENAPGSYYVGGCLRDLLLGRPTRDLDLLVPRDPAAVGRRLANWLGGHFFWLRREERVARVLSAEEPVWQLDLSPLIGALAADLRRRDLTINTLAQPVEAGFDAAAPLVDATGGLADLNAGLLRLPAPDALEADALRALRVIRFRWSLDFRLDDDLRAALPRQAKPLAEVSAERRRDELFQLLALPDAAAGLADLERFGLLAALLPDAGEPPPGRPGALAAVAALESALAELPPDTLSDYLEERLCEGRRRREAALWLAALWGWGAPQRASASAAARALALSAREARLLRKALDALPAAIGVLVRWPAPGRERFRLWQACRDAEVETILLAGVAGAERGPGWRALLAEARAAADNPPEALLKGEEVMAILGIGAGPAVGGWLQALAEEQAEGGVDSPEAARRWLLAQAAAKPLADDEESRR